MLRVTLIGAACTVLLLGAGNYDGFIASYNAKTIYAENPGYSAVDELRDLGPDGVPYIMELTKSVNPKVAEKADEVLYDLCYDYYGYDYDFDSAGTRSNSYAPIFDFSVKTQSGFNRWNLPVAKAYEALDAYFTGDTPLRDAVTDRLTELTTAPEVSTEGATEP